MTRVLSSPRRFIAAAPLAMLLLCSHASAQLEARPLLAEPALGEFYVANRILPPEGYLPIAGFSDSAPEAVPVDPYQAPLYPDDWGLHILPEGLIYRSYLAGPKESRLSAGLISLRDDTTTWDATLGARVALFRVGTSDPIRPRGFEVGVEASAQVRLDIPEEVDVRSTDYRVGMPIVWGDERHQWKLAYYHISSHLGDEFLLKNPGFPRFFQSRDAFVFGYSHYVRDSLRIYGEVGWAFASNASEPWEIQLGLDYAPRHVTGIRGAPFVAINGHLRQEVEFGGGFTFQTGWAWRSDRNAHLLRLGLQYYNGPSPQYVFLPFHEQQIGVAVWYDF